MTTRVFIPRPWEVSGLLSGRITQLRRPCALNLSSDCVELRSDSASGWRQWFLYQGRLMPKAWRDFGRCPFGSPGDMLLCKEAYAIESSVYALQALPFDDGRPILRTESGWRQAHYRATDPMPALMCEHEDCDGDPCARPWRPAQTMPRDLIRLKPVVVSVRAERANAITHTDIAALGFSLVANYRAAPGPGTSCCCWGELFYRDQWDADYGKRYPWDSMPWQWVCDVAPEGQ